MKTKTAEQATKNWEGAIPQVGSRYQDGVRAASGVIEASKAADGLWKAKMQEAMSRDARNKGLDKVSDEEWRKKTLEKGAPRITQGMTASKDDFRKGIGEVISALQSISLPPRGATVDENIERVRVVAKGLNERFKK